MTYVKFDALVNYVTAAGYGTEEFNQYWPADVHVIGKDILAPHAVYWPIMLKASNLLFPDRYSPMGGGLLPEQRCPKAPERESVPCIGDQYGADAFRFFVMEMTGSGCRIFPRAFFLTL